MNGDAVAPSPNDQRTIDTIDTLIHTVLFACSVLPANTPASNAVLAITTAAWIIAEEAADGDREAATALITDAIPHAAEYAKLVMK